MRSNMLVSVITTTYNRDKLLLRLFNTLQKQSNYNFEWIVIDDGSDKKFQEVFSKIERTETIFKKRIFHQCNQGKHAALNNAFNHIKGEVTVIIDSDDIVLPNTIDTIIKKWTNSRLADPTLAAIIFERGTESGEPLNIIKDNNKRANINQYRYFNNLNGDLAETYKSSIIKKYHFPVQKNEKILSEDYVWIDIGRKYDAIFYHQILYQTKYLSSGLTHDIHQIMWKNPIGSLMNTEKRVGIRVPFKLQIKFNIMFEIFVRRNKLSLTKELRKTKYPKLAVVLWPVSFLVYCYYHLKYGEKNDEAN